MATLKEFREELLDVMMRKNLTIKDVAESNGVSVACVWRWLTGNNRPVRVARVEAVANARAWVKP